VSLFFDKVCDHRGETLPYRAINSQGAFGGRISFPKDCDAATAADSLVREAMPRLTNRLQHPLRLPRRRRRAPAV
jgi:hypothetical protein